MEVQVQQPPTQEQVQQTPSIKTPSVDRIALRAKIKTSANWFYWLAGLSVLNTILVHSGVEIAFIFGLGFTQVADGIVLGLIEATQSSIIMIVGMMISMMIAGAFALFGFLANKHQKLGFLVGLIFYCLDALIFLLFAEWISFGFHIFALWRISSGYKALSKLQAASATPAFPEQ
ncbi:MAG: hypothetical protein R3F48_06115 [Candidatus Zixiibacteriota bacterium]